MAAGSPPATDRPADWTGGHHLKHWAEGGETTRQNVLLLCRRHHRKVHEEGWRLAWGEDGGVIAIPPLPTTRVAPMS